MIFKRSIIFISLITKQFLIGIDCSAKFYRNHVISLADENDLLKIVLDKIFSYENTKTKVEQALKSIHGKNKYFNFESRIEDILGSLGYNGVITFEGDSLVLSVNLKLQNDDSDEMVSFGSKIKFDSKLLSLKYEEGKTKKFKVKISYKDFFKSCNQTKLINFLMKSFLNFYNENDGEEEEEEGGMELNISENSELASQGSKEEATDINSNLQADIDETIEGLDEKSFMMFEFSFSSLPNFTNKVVSVKFGWYVHTFLEEDEVSEVDITKILEEENLFSLKRRSDHDKMNGESSYSCFSGIFRWIFSYFDW